MFRFNPFTATFDLVSNTAKKIYDIAISDTIPTDGQVLGYNDTSGEWEPVTLSSGGSGDVTGPSSSVDNTLPVFDGTTGKLLKEYPNNAMTVDSLGRVDFFNPSYSNTFRLGGGNVLTNGEGATAIGHNARADLRGTAIGRSASTGGNDDAVAIGYIAAVTGVRGFAMGRQAIAGAISVALGYQANASGQGAITMGSATQATGLSSVALGNGAKARANYSIAIGELNDISSSANDSIAIGRRSGSSHSFSIMLGTLTESTDDNQFMVGNGFRHPIKEFIFGTGSAGHSIGSMASLGDTELFFNEFSSNITDATPNNVIFNAPAGKGTGDGGHLIFKTSPAGASGSNRNAGQIVLELTDEREAKFGGSIHKPIRTVTSNTTLGSEDHTIIADASGGAITVTLPPAADAEGRVYFIKKISSGNSVLVDADSTELIDGSQTLSLSSQYRCEEIQSDGTQWWVISSK